MDGVFNEKLDNIKKDVEDLKNEHEKTKKDVCLLRDEFKEELHKISLDSAVQFTKIASELTISKNASIDVKHLLLEYKAETKKEKEDKEKEEKATNKFNLTTVIAVISLIASIVLGIIALK